MRHEKTIKREDGSKVLIKVVFSCDFTRLTPDWSFDVFTCEKGKRTWNAVCDRTSYGFRRLSSDERPQKIRDEFMRHVTAEEVESVMLELWDNLRQNQQTVADCHCRA